MLFFRDKKQQNQSLQESGMKINLRTPCSHIPGRLAGFQIPSAGFPPDSCNSVNDRQLSPPVNSILLAKVSYTPYCVLIYYNSRVLTVINLLVNKSCKHPPEVTTTIEPWQLPQNLPPLLFRDTHSSTGTQNKLKKAPCGASFSLRTLVRGVSIQ